MRLLYHSCQFLLIILWIYAGATKLINFERTKLEMADQIFDASFASMLAWMIPSVELIAGLLIAMPLTARYGLWISTLLLFVFTVYIAGGIFHWYETVPCSCGGILRHMSWGWHFLFNLFSLSLTIIALIVQPFEKEGSGTQH